MRIVIQRVKSAKVIISDSLHSSIKQGLLCFVGFSEDDNIVDFEWAINKLIKLKLFNGSSLQDVKGELLLVSQFTLFARIKKGTKPSWSRAANPVLAKKLYKQFLTMCEEVMPSLVKSGVFGADMEINSVNYGPLTLVVDTKKKE